MTIDRDEIRDEIRDEVIDDCILEDLKLLILSETKNVASFVTIGETLHKLYYKDKLLKNQKEFLLWTKINLGFSKSTTYEYIISYKIYNAIVLKLPLEFPRPLYQSHCQLLSKIPEELVCGVWMDCINKAPNGVITTAILEAHIQSIEGLKKKSPRKRIKNSSNDIDEDNFEKDSIDNESLQPFNVTPKKMGKPHAKLKHIEMRSEECTQSNGNIFCAFDAQRVYETSLKVIQNYQFDKVCNSISEFIDIEDETWFGRIYCDLSLGKSYLSTGDEFCGIERLLQIIFTRYANKEYSEGLFIIRAEFGADWFTPILQHPTCILRQSHTSLSTPFTSYVVFYMGANVESFCTHFRRVGLIAGLNSWAREVDFSSIVPSALHNTHTQSHGHCDFEEEYLDVNGGDLSEAASALCQMTHLDD